MDREMPLGTHAAQWLLRRAWFRRALKLPVLGALLAHPWRLFIGVIFLVTTSRFVANAIREPWHGGFGQWKTVVELALLAFAIWFTLIRLLIVWRKDGIAAAKKDLSSRWQRIITPPSETQ